MFAVLLVLSVLIAASVLPVKVLLMLLRPRLRTPDEIIDEESADGSISPRVLQQKWKAFETITADSVMIRGQLLEGSAAKWIIFCHGISGNSASAYRYAEPFLDAGWGLVLFDFREHGRSGAGLPSYGFRERFDLDAVVKHLLREYPGAEFHLYGISMGAATVLQYLPIASGISSAASDSSFSSLKEQLLFRFESAGIPRIIHRPLLLSVSLLLRLYAGFAVEAVNPAESASNSPIPLLLIHAEDDPEVPVRMCGIIAALRPEPSATEIYRPAKGGHTRAAVLNPLAWKERVNGFFKLQQRD